MPLQGVDFAALEALQADLFAKKLAPKTVHHVLADVRTFLRWCARRKWIAAVPEIPVTLLEEYAPTIPSRDEQRARLAVMHGCDNPACIDIDHLMLGTQRANVLDRQRKGRGVLPR